MMSDRQSEDSQLGSIAASGKGSAAGAAVYASAGGRAAAAPAAAETVARTVLPVVLGVSLIHMLNDSMQSVVPSILPAMQRSLHLTYTQIGLVIFALNMTSSVLQPAIGIFSDRRPSPFMLPLGMLLSLVGLAGIAFAPNYGALLAAVVFVGLGSAIFHPEGSKVVYLAAGDRRGLAQSIYQVGGNGGSSLQPLMTRYLFLPFGQIAALWFTAVAAAAVVVSWVVSRWYKANLPKLRPRKRQGVDLTLAAESAREAGGGIGRKAVLLGMGLLIVLTFARSTYYTAIMNYYQYFFAEQYAATVADAQLPLFLFGLFGVVGTFIGGPLADRYGAKNVIFGSMAGATPLAAALPFLPQMFVVPVLIALSVILMSGFSVVVVYAQMLMPKHIGTASGLIVGLAFGMGALGAVVLGSFIDWFGLQPVFIGASALPLIGLVTFKLPDLRKS
jgi:FSR family fosmidomycin resistance protein-like MFS transporter